MFKNTTPLSNEANIKFMKYTNNYSLKVLSVFFIFFQIITLIPLILKQEVDTIILACMPLIMFALSFLMLKGFIPLLSKVMIKSIQRNPMTDENNINYYEFNEDELIVTTIRLEKETGRSIIEYKNILQFAIYKNDMYIYINAQQAFILEGNKMTEGRFNDLVKFLRTKPIKKIIPKEKKEKGMSELEKLNHK